MLKKWFLGTVLAAGVAGAALAANIPLITGALDPANEQQAINQTILAVNAGVTGTLAALPAAFTTTGTTLNTVLSYTAPGGLLSAVGQGIHIRAWGVNSADANVKTVAFSYGAFNCSPVVTGSGNTWVLDFNIVKTGAATQTYQCDGKTGTTNVASLQATATNTDASATTVLVSAIAATSGTITVAGAYIEQLK